MRKLESLSLVIPHRNWRLDVVELSLKSLEMQTRQADEIMILDIANDESQRNELRELCQKYGIIPLQFDFDVPEKVIDVHLWNICINHGIRNSTADLVICSGVDKIYEKNMVECVLDWYNWTRERRKLDGFICGSVHNLKRVPKLSELEDFDALIGEAKWRGGYGLWGASREWWHKTRGIDETLRWYEELDLAARAHRIARKSVIWVSHGKIKNWLGKQTRTLHIAIHPPSRKKVREADVEAIARRGRFERAKDKTIARNDEDWGIITERKVQRALWLSRLTQEEFEEFHKQGIDPLDHDKFE